MRILAHSKNGMLKIGTDHEKGEYIWYFLDESIKDMFRLENGTEVEINSKEEGTDKILTAIKGIGGIKIIPPTVVETVDRTESIIRQAIMKAACAAIPALAGLIDPNTIGEVTIALYEKLLKKVKE